MIKTLICAALCGLLVACGGGDPVDMRTTTVDGPVTIASGRGDTLIARVQIECPDVCVVMVNHDAKLRWSEPGNHSVRSVIQVAGIRTSDVLPSKSGVLHDTTRQNVRIGRTTRLDAGPGLVTVEFRLGHAEPGTLTVSDVLMTAEVLQ